LLVQYELPVIGPVDVDACHEGGERWLTFALRGHLVDRCGRRVGQLNGPRLRDAMGWPRLLVGQGLEERGAVDDHVGNDQYGVVGQPLLPERAGVG
jgi:hypothetical protein